MKKTLNLQKETGKFSTLPTEKYGLVVEPFAPDVVLTPMNEDNTRSYPRIILPAVATNVWAGDAGNRIYVVVKESDTVVTVTDYYKGGKKVSV